MAAAVDAKVGGNTGNSAQPAVQPSDLAQHVVPRISRVRVDVFVVAGADEYPQLKRRIDGFEQGVVGQLAVAGSIEEPPATAKCTR